ncbi:hypothetical protein GGR54DRAFT_496840 [Hypoxylon sp. NC1633]|nr:hypothetical protein GGR54DRAFT_496840 [Hypoxylon sp. NC1633]
MDLSSKRPSTSNELNQIRPAKRQHVVDLGSRPVAPPDDETSEMDNASLAEAHFDPSVIRAHLTRSIVLVLHRIGFDSSTKLALESLTSTVDIFIRRFIAQLMHSQTVARRTKPGPIDFQLALEAFDISLVDLIPHLTHPVSKEELTPSYRDINIEEITRLLKPRPDLGEELSGEKEKESRPWTPKNSPPFPPPYQYRYTPSNQESKTDDKKAQAETDAKKGELALRLITRAGRISRQKEVKATSDLESSSQKRHENWESMLTDLLPENGSSNGTVEIADHSAIVDTGSKYSRRVAPKANRRTQSDSFGGLN